MPNITKTARKLIHETLDSTDFSVMNFDISYPEAEDELLEITYIDNEYYYFSLKHDIANLDIPFHANFSPGGIFVDVDDNVEQFDGVLKLIEIWCENIKNEVFSSSFAFSEIEKMKEEFNRKLNENIKEKGEKFGSDEIKSLKKTLSDFSKELDKLKKENKITAMILNEIKKDLNQLKRNLEILPKKSWLRSASGKLWNISAKLLTSKAGQALIVKITDRLLLPPTN